MELHLVFFKSIAIGIKTENKRRGLAILLRVER